MTAHEEIFVGPDADQVIVHPLDSMTLVFQKSSGITHIVSDPVPAILEALNGRAMSVAELQKFLTKQYDMGAAADVAAILTERLTEMAALGLVEKS